MREVLRKLWLRHDPGMFYLRAVRDKNSKVYGGVCVTILEELGTLLLLERLLSAMQSQLQHSIS
jgi:hypothetical protein